MRRYISRSLCVAWKAYVVLCVVLVSAYIILLVSVQCSKRFDMVQFPNGSYLAHRSFFFWNREDIVLRHSNGKILVNESVDWVCFNERFVEGNTFYEPKPDFSIYTSRRFIYEKGDDEAVFNIDPRYDDVLDRSDLIRPDGCGIRGAVTGFYSLVQDPKYGR